MPKLTHLTKWVDWHMDVLSASKCDMPIKYKWKWVDTDPAHDRREVWTSYTYTELNSENDLDGIK